MEDLVEKYSLELTKCLLNNEVIRFCGLIRKHTVDLKKNGDLSFPTNRDAWIPNLPVSVLENQNDWILGESFSDIRLMEKINKRELPISKISRAAADRINVFLNRSEILRQGLTDLENTSSPLLNNKFQFIDVFIEISNLTDMRQILVEHAASNYFELIDPEKVVSITTKSHKGCTGEILCGPVLNLETGQKEQKVTSSLLLQERGVEVHLQARHKFAQRPTEKWAQLLNDIAKSVVTYELLHIKPSSALKLDMKPGSASARAGAFIEYNCARIEKLLKTFDEQVEKGYYPHLPKIENIDFSLLKEEDEWKLFFNYIFPFEHTFGRRGSPFSPHTICSYCSSLVRDFSVYYKKTIILRENRHHLLPALFARIHLLKALSKVLKSLMRIINMKIVTEM